MLRSRLSQSICAMAWLPLTQTAEADVCADTCCLADARVTWNLQWYEVCTHAHQSMRAKGRRKIGGEEWRTISPQMGLAPSRQQYCQIIRIRRVWCVPVPGNGCNRNTKYQLSFDDHRSRIQTIYKTYLLPVSPWLFFLALTHLDDVVAECLFTVAHLLDAAETLVFAVFRGEVVEWRPGKW